MKSRELHKERILFFPLKVLLYFLVFTEVFLFVGPNVYPIQSPFLLIMFLIIVNIAFFRGYRKGISHYYSSNYHFKLSTVHIIITLGFILNVIRLFEMWNRRGLLLSINTLVIAVLNPGEVYYSESMEAVTSSLFTTFLSPITWAALPIGLYKWKDINLFCKILVIITIIVEAVTWLGVGTRKGLLDLIIIIGFMTFINNIRKSSTTKIRKRAVIEVIIAIAVFITYFIVSNLSRYGYSLSEINQFNIDHEIRAFYTNFPHWLLVTLSNINGYLCQGYYALSVALSKGIIPPTFLGMSWFTMVIASKLGLNPMPGTYLALLEQYGIDSHVNWHTIYVWLANDFTFIGVPILIYMIGMMLARTWRDCIMGNNDIAVPLFSLFLIMVFYFFANNQVLSFSFMPFVVWWLLYSFSLSKRKLT